MTPIGYLALALCVGGMVVISELRWRDSLSRPGRVLVPVVLGLIAFAAWVLIEGARAALGGHS